MRNPSRIFEITSKICAEWYVECPDWRFMQLMSNFITWLGHDPFYMEDDEFLQKFYEYMDTMH